MEQFTINPIGRVIHNGEEIQIEVYKKYIPALKELDDFSHLNVLYWFSDCDIKEVRDILEVESPYKNSPDVMGIFATRGPVRPNPIALTTVQILSIDHEKGIIYIPFIDANDHTPVIDLKPYTPSFDRILNPTVPNWCKHWPRSSEESGNFNWEDEFNF